MNDRCPASFWRFAGPVIAGNLAALGVGYVVKRSMSETTHPTTRKTVSMFAGGATFWLVGGLTWVAMHPRDRLSLTDGANF